MSRRTVKLQLRVLSFSCIYKSYDFKLPPDAEIANAAATNLEKLRNSHAELVRSDLQYCRDPPHEISLQLQGSGLITDQIN